MNQALSRLYLMFLSLLVSITLLGQDLDDIDLDGGMSKRGQDDMSPFDAMDDYHPIHFGISDVIMVVLLLVACYVFGKIWKGCSYFILVIAAIFYYMIRN